MKNETSKLLEENKEFLDARLRGKELVEQVKELDEVISQANRLKDALISERTKKKEE